MPLKSLWRPFAPAAFFVRRAGVVTNGLLRVGVANAELLGDGGAYVEVRDGGTFDVNATTNTADAILTTCNKKFRIAGKGFNGMGAINNMGTDGSVVAAQTRDFSIRRPCSTCRAP